VVEASDSPLFGELKRKPQVGVLDGREVEAAAEHADDGVADAVHDQRLAERELVAAEAFADLREAVDDVAFGVDTGIRAGYEPAYLSYNGTTFNIRDDPQRYVGDLAELVAGGEFVKLLVLQESGDADALTDAVRKVLGDRLAATHSSVDRPLVEVAAAGVSKASTLAALCERLGVAPDEVAAFGDMPNDLEMLSWVGRPYVMADAHPDLLALEGAEVIGSNADSAVGAMIETLVA